MPSRLGILVADRPFVNPPDQVAAAGVSLIVCAVVLDTGDAPPGEGGRARPSQARRACGAAPDRPPRCTGFTSPACGKQHVGPAAEVHLGRRPAAEGQVGAPVVVIQQGSDQPPGVVSADDLLQINGLVLQRPPQTLDEPVVHPPGLAVQVDPHPRVQQRPHERLAGERPTASGRRLPWSVFEIDGAP